MTELNDIVRSPLLLSPILCVGFISFEKSL